MSSYLPAHCPMIINIPEQMEYFVWISCYASLFCLTVIAIGFRKTFNIPCSGICSAKFSTGVCRLSLRFYPAFSLQDQQQTDIPCLFEELQDVLAGRCTHLHCQTKTWSSELKFAISKKNFRLVSLTCSTLHHNSSAGHSPSNDLTDLVHYFFTLHTFWVRAAGIGFVKLNTSMGHLVTTPNP